MRIDDLFDAELRVILSYLPTGENKLEEVVVPVHEGRSFAFPDEQHGEFVIWKGKKSKESLKDYAKQYVKNNNLDLKVVEYRQGKEKEHIFGSIQKLHQKALDILKSNTDQGKSLRLLLFNILLIDRTRSSYSLFDKSGVLRLNDMFNRYVHFLRSQITNPENEIADILSGLRDGMKRGETGVVSPYYLGVLGYRVKREIPIHTQRYSENDKVALEIISDLAIDLLQNTLESDEEVCYCDYGTVYFGEEYSRRTGSIILTNKHLFSIGLYPDWAKELPGQDLSMFYILYQDGEKMMPNKMLDTLGLDEMKDFELKEKNDWGSPFPRLEFRYDCDFFSSKAYTIGFSLKGVKKGFLKVMIQPNNGLLDDIAGLTEKLTERVPSILENAQHVKTEIEAVKSRRTGH